MIVSAENTKGDISLSILVFLHSVQHTACCVTASFGLLTVFLCLCICIMFVCLYVCKYCECSTHSLLLCLSPVFVCAQFRSKECKAMFKHSKYFACFVPFASLPNVLNATILDLSFWLLWGCCITGR